MSIEIPQNNVRDYRGGDLYSPFPGMFVIEKPHCKYDTYQFELNKTFTNPILFFAASTGQKQGQDPTNSNNTSGGKQLISTDFKVYDIEAYIISEKDIFDKEYIEEMNDIRKAMLSIEIEKDACYESNLHRHLKLISLQSAETGQISLNTYPMKGAFTIPKGCAFKVEVRFPKDRKAFTKLDFELQICLVGRTTEPRAKAVSI